MLTNLTIKRYKSLYNVSMVLEPLTVFIGPNGSGKSNICEVLAIIPHMPEPLFTNLLKDGNCQLKGGHLQRTIDKLPNNIDSENMFWRGIVKSIDFQIKGYLRKTKIYNFIPYNIAKISQANMQVSGEGIANTLANILFDNRDSFTELEEIFVKLVPNISRISLTQDNNRLNLLRLVDVHSDYKMPASNVSDGTLRLLAFLAALYDIDAPDIICFEEPENGVHPWLLHKIMALLNQVSQQGIRGNPVQILVTTHSPLLLNYVEPEQIRAVELDEEGRTQVRALPTDSVRFQKALDAYDGELGELWFTNLFGANPV